MNRSTPRAYFDRIKPVFLENWPPQLQRIAMPHIPIPLTREEAETLATSPCLYRNRLTITDPAPLHSLANKLSFPIVAFGYNAFVRLGSRSPKDSDLFQTNRGLVKGPVTAIKMLQTSLRVREDLRRCLEFGYQPELFIREWMPIEPWREFRCILKAGELAGVTQVETSNPGRRAPSPDEARAIADAIYAFVPEFKHACPLDTVVFDLVITPDRDSPAGYAIQVMDLNPFGPETSTGLFRWGANDLDGSFRCFR